MPWGAALAAGATLYAADKQSSAADKAAKSSKDATAQAIAQQNLNYDRTAANLNPYIGAGTSALGGLDRLASGDYSGFESSPDYQFTLAQGLQGLDRSAAARGNLFSGGQQADILKYAQGLAGTQLGNYRNFLTGLAGMGQGAASNLGSIGAGQAGSIGNYLMGNAGAQADAGYNNANASTNLANQLAGLGGQLYGQWNNNPANVTTSSYSGPLSASAPYTGNNSLATSWPGMNGGATGGTTWPGFGNGFTLAGG